ncbi:hypothetical protein ZOSMA_73G00170 [Zostera marina]|uniref:DNA-binding protein BIN4 n=1 Tax=Zostera marina TaxID=29655 RepID=A0A0K9NS44_ZOSMR|nr:hypothetical protein ZOSMA_73G00170 [Zostera marina]
MDDGDDSIREKSQSPDWLRSFQGPSKDFVTISSSSEPSLSNSSHRNEENTHNQSVSGRVEIDDVFVDIGDKKSMVKSKTLQKEKQEEDNDIFDSGDDKPIAKEKKSETMKKEKQEDQGLEDACEGESSKKPSLHNVSSRLPLILPEKVQRSKALIECEGDSIDLSGDVGAVGRVIISKNASGNDEMLLDLKGTIYKSRIVPSTTFCIVSFGQTEAKIESIMTDYVQLTPHSNVFEAETMIEGTLDGFSFGSEDEGDHLPKTSTRQTNQDNENMDQTKGKRSGKVDKGSAVTRKKAKTAGKPVKRAVRKPQTTKKGKGAKK